MRHGALYATVYRAGRLTEHRLAGVRLGQIGCMIDWHLPTGWTFTVHGGRAAIRVNVAPPRNDPRVEAFIDRIFEQSRAAPVEPTPTYRVIETLQSRDKPPLDVLRRSGAPVEP